MRSSYSPPPEGEGDVGSRRGADKPVLKGYETADPILYGLLKELAAKNRQQETEAEKILWRFLRDKQPGGFKFKRQHIISRFIADFVCLEKALIVEVDGKMHQLPENQENDAERTAALEQLGFTVIRFSNDAVVASIDQVLAAILHQLNTRPASPLWFQKKRSSTTQTGPSPNIALPPGRSVREGATIFSFMSALALEHGAVNLSQGFPDFPVEPRLGELLYEGFQQGFNQYAPMPGLPLLREAIAGYLTRRMGIAADPAAEITVTPGATYAIYTAFAAVLQPGGEVIVPEPAYDSYVPNILAQRAVPVPVPLNPEDFSPDWEAIRKAITPRTRAIIINTPHNPTGAVWSSADFDALAALLDGTDIFVISDEVYEQLVFDGRRHHSVLQHETLRRRAFAVFSFGKVFQNTGWKVGYCVAPPALTEAFRRVHQYLVFSVNTPAQYALGQFLEEQPGLDMAPLLQQKRDLFLSLMQATPFRMPAPAAGTFFQLASYAGLSDLPDKQFAIQLTKEAGVAAIPVSSFYSDGTDNRLLRFCFAKQDETLKAAADKLLSPGLSKGPR